MYLTESGGVKFGFFGLTKMAQRFFQNGEVIQSTDFRVYEGDVLTMGLLLMELYNYDYDTLQDDQSIPFPDECYYYVAWCLHNDVKKKTVVKKLMTVHVLRMNDE